MAGEGSRGSFDLYKLRWAWSRVLWEWKRLGIAGSSPGLRCALVSGARSLAGMAGWFGRDRHGFRAVAREMVHGVVV
jgi:hypothetical protein